MLRFSLHSSTAQFDGAGDLVAIL